MLVFGFKPHLPDKNKNRPQGRPFFLLERAKGYGTTVPLRNGTQPFGTVIAIPFQTGVSLDLRLKTVRRTLFNPRPLSGSNPIHPIKIKTATRTVFYFYWSGRRDLNPRHRPWQGRALPLSYTRNAE